MKNGQDKDCRRILGIFKGQEKILAFADYSDPLGIWRIIDRDGG